MIVAIDGPAGSGKTTVAKELAQSLGFSYLDTGATYRALTYSALEEAVDLGSEQSLADLAAALSLEVKGIKVYVRGKEVTKDIRAPRIDKNISKVVGFAAVRQIMSSLQRSIAQGKDYVVEGRDITTVVFPDAEFKFYLDADQKIRTKRRTSQLMNAGEAIDSEEVKQDLINRDQADATRKHGSLRLAKDACYIDTTSLSAQEVVGKLLSIIRGRA